MGRTIAFGVLAAAFALGGCIVEDYPRNHPRYRHRYAEPAPVIVQPAATVVQPAPVVVAGPTRIVETSPVIVYPPGGPHSGTIRPPRRPPRRHHAARPAPKPEPRRPVVVKSPPKAVAPKKAAKTPQRRDSFAARAVSVKPAPKRIGTPAPKRVGTPPPKRVGK